MILAGDIGGTKVNVALFDIAEDGLRMQDFKTYASADYKGLGELCEDYIKQTGAEFDAACFGIAGAVVDGECHATNLPWTVKTDDLKTQLKTDDVYLINDLVSAIMGLPVLSGDDVDVFQEGNVDPQGPIALISAGTGLGMALLLSTDSGKLRALPSEGGHSCFAPVNERQAGLLAFLLKENKQVSCESVLSGPGVVNIYRYLREENVVAESDELAAAVDAASDKAAEISKLAAGGTSELCKETMAMFVDIYGSVAGNYALSGLATGGVYIGGGIVDKNAKLFGEGFMKNFKNKGKMEAFMDRFRVGLIRNQNLGLCGAANYAFMKQQNLAI